MLPHRKIVIDFRWIYFVVRPHNLLCPYYEPLLWFVITYVTRSTKRGLIAFSITCTRQPVTWLVNMLSPWYLVHLSSLHGTMAGYNMKVIGWKYDDNSGPFFADWVTYTLKLNFQTTQKTVYICEKTRWEPITLSVAVLNLLYVY